MLDIKYIRENVEKVRKDLEARNSDFDLNKLLDLDIKRRSLLVEIETLKKERNDSSQLVAKYKKENKDVSPIIKRVQEVNEKIKEIDITLEKTVEDFSKLIYTMPNKLSDTTPIGKDENQNVEIRRWGEIPEFKFSVKSHDELGVALDILDFERGAKLSGSRFTVYKNQAARLERAIISFMLDTHTQENGFTEMLVPQLVKREMMVGTGQLPKFEEDMYKIDDEEMFLIPTAEVPLTNIYSGEILEEEELPKHFVGFTACFRKEAGSGGRDLKGLIRQHQFNKVEMVKIAHPKNSYEELETMVKSAESILQKLKLPYRVVALCSGDLGFSAAKTYDLEVWVPSQNKYREISSCSNTEDFQARRARIKYRSKEDNNSYFVHTLNGSGLAVGRTLLAIMENYQNEDGSITIPDVLVPYMGGLKVIKK